MNNLSKMLGLSVLCVAMKANAQQPTPATAPSDPPAPAGAPAPVAAPAPAAKPKATAQSEAGEPRANTSRPATPQSEAGEPRANTSRPATAQSEAGEPRANTSKAPPAAARPPGVAGQKEKAPGASDRLELGTATVTGDREQPKVMYIVPWKKSDIGDLAGKPMNSLVDEILAPVDRDVFKREVVYYKAVQADASQNGAPGRPSEQGEK
jgi:hypothetical protein